MRGFYSPIDKLAADIPRTKGTGAEFMTELSKRPGYKPAEAEDRNLQTLMALPKMERAQFLQALKAKPAPSLEESERVERPQDPDDARTKYEEYTIPGGENYREILLNMPHDPNRKQSPSSSHWDSPDVLAHVRAKDRTGPNGEKILHIEEVQSDWHQAGREKGYRSSIDDTVRKNTKNAYEQARDALNSHRRDMAVTDAYMASDAPMWQQPEAKARLKARQREQNKVLMDLMAKTLRADTEYQNAQRAEKDTAPDAPFKKNWHELALKKMIHHAATNGYDSIAITPGAEQVKRYGLAKQIAKLHYNADINALRAFNHSGREVISEYMTPDKLPAFVGKDVAQSLLSTPQEFGVHTLEGQDLNVGGAGMKGFYDKMIPSFLNQFGKKYGAKVGTTGVGGSSNPTDEQARVHHGFGILRWRTKSPEEKEQLRQQAVSAPFNLHTFPITPEMRDDVTKNGVPLYAEGGKVEEDVPRETIKGYKLFRVHPKHPGKLFPLFIGKHKPVEMGKWIPAEGIPTKGFAERPGWHAGDLPMATHIGEKSDTSLTAPDRRPHNQVWTEVEMPNDVDWQTEANKRGTNKQGRVIPVKAHITDQVPTGGHYRYKTNPNMTGSWLIGGAMKVNRVLNDKEVKAINRTAKQSDLPRNEPFDSKRFGFAGGGTIKPVGHGYTREQVTVAPNLDAMKYELMSVKHFAKKAK